MAKRDSRDRKDQIPNVRYSCAIEFLKIFWSSIILLLCVDNTVTGLS